MSKQTTGAYIYWIQLCLDSGCCIQLAPIPQDMGVELKTLIRQECQPAEHQDRIMRALKKKKTERREG